MLTLKLEQNVRRKFRFTFLFKKTKKLLQWANSNLLRITVDGVPGELSTKRMWEAHRWKIVSERTEGTKEDAKTLNVYLDTLQTKAYEAKRRLIDCNQIITAAAIKNEMLGNKQRDKMLVKIFQEYNERVEQLIGIDY